MRSEENIVNSLATELVDEAVGASHRKGLLFLFALVLGAGIAVWFLRHNGGGSEEIANEVTPVPAPAGAAVG